MFLGWTGRKRHDCYMSDHDEPEARARPKSLCFEDREQAAAIDLSLMKLMGQLRDRHARTFVSEDNVQRYNHGSTWHRPAKSEGTDVRMHTIQATWEISFQDIVDNDLGLIGRSILPASEEMDRQFAGAMYAMVSDAATSVGNVVDAKTEGGVAQSFLAMLRKIEFGVDRDGNLSLPEIHLGPSMFDKVVSELSDQPPEFSAEVERIKAAKAVVAFAREDERKRRFKRRDSA